MEKAKHTEAPWFINRDSRPGMEWNNHISSAVHPHLTVCFMTHDGTPENEVGEANARLVAAAPEMLEALKVAMWIKSQLELMGDFGTNLIEWDEIEAVIRKAESD